MVPVLLDLDEETLYARQVKANIKLGTLPTSNQKQRMRQHNRNTISNETHTILWFNGPDYFSLDFINSQFQNCLYSNCLATSDRALLKKSSAILFCTTCEKMGRGPPLKIDERPTNQVWVLFSTEPPHNHLYQDDFRHHLWKDTVNWSMTYRQDSDIFMPYGSGGFRGGSRGSLEPPSGPKLFHFHREFQEILCEIRQTNPPFLHLNPLFRNPGSATVWISPNSNACPRAELLGNISAKNEICGLDCQSLRR